ncbi:MAG: CorA family divalent cation transporter, partial [Chitinophagales bacterium]|nr:CorA family divalent cation transporter [Chitinophagales bacterium]
MDTKQNLVSYHIFLYPFKWELQGDTKKFSEKTNLNKLRCCFEKSHKNWEPYFFNCDENNSFSRQKYNEYLYFYPFVRKVLYPIQNNNSSAEHPITIQYRYKTYRDNPLYYQVAKKCKTSGQNSKIYDLLVDDILLYLYETGVGIISFHLKNTSHTHFTDVLSINKFGRRVSVPYLDYANGIDGTRDSELPLYICLKDQKNNLTICEDFQYFKKEEQIEFQKYYLSAVITGLFQKGFFCQPGDKGKVMWEPVLDDRMFVVCWAGIDGIIAHNDNSRHDAESRQGNAAAIHHEHETIQVNQNTTESEKYPAAWYKMIFVDDTSPGCANDVMMHNLIREHTYARWQQYGTLYGMSRYSLVCLTNSLPELQRVNAAMLPVHMRTMYYKMVLLNLLCRASVLRFSDEISGIAGKLNNENIAGYIEDLYKAYIEFINKIYFREVTAQEQGIEMYQLMQRVMNIPENIKDLDKEFQELHQFVTIKGDKERNERVKKLNEIAMAFLPATLLVGIMGMNGLFELCNYTFDRNGSIWVFILNFFLVLSLIYALCI